MKKSNFHKKFYNSIKFNQITKEHLLVKVPKNHNNNKVTCRTMNIMKNTTFTEEGEVSLDVVNNLLKWENSDCALIAVFERYGKNNNVAFGLVKEAVKLGMTIENAIYVATYTPAKRMRLFDRGTIAPGKIADFILLDDIRKFDIYEVYKNGEIVFNKYNGLKEEYFMKKSNFDKKFYNSIKLNKITKENLLVKVPQEYNNKVTCRTMNVMKNILL